MTPWSSNLGNRLSTRFNRTGNITDLKEAIDSARRAIKITPQGHPDLTGLLNNLGIMLLRRYNRTGSVDDLEDTINITRRAISLTAPDHPNFAKLLSSFADKTINSV
ncbi:hypothetical protein ETB97_007037 [Aspergillus alliaceus]|uniref:Uncharacterized protein n=1 Tax=Petromyces alliaceus TaxID=209559 RepID=A0A8H6E388_PETAA|nr:hypothetical protein ETB97_007037 [Aspergillus burnettii]